MQVDLSVAFASNEELATAEQVLQSQGQVLTQAVVKAMQDSGLSMLESELDVQLSATRMPATDS
eukprot:4617073-Ditylum_brightwellii.AAC.1